MASMTSSDAPPIIAPAFVAAEINAPVFLKIISIYSSSLTSNLSSKPMSDAWPSQILTHASATVAKVLLFCSELVPSLPTIISNAFENNVSPARIATSSPQTL